MIEQKIEKIVIEQLKAAIDDADLSTTIQTIGAWQSSINDQIKAFENGKAIGVLGIKVYPRQYETPTIPDGSFQVEVTLNIRAEVDTQGQTWLNATEAISNKLQTWQKSYAAYKPVFEIANEFLPTGFNITGGDCGLDKENELWTYSQSFNLFGVIS